MRVPGPASCFLSGLLLSALACGDGTAPRFEAFVVTEGVRDPSRMRERGIGVIGFEPGPLPAGRVADTLDVRADPASGADVIARLVLDTAGVYRYEALEGMLEEQGTLEFGYEIVGLVLLERSPDGWVRVYLGKAPGGAVASGWTRVRPGALGLTLWEELLPRQALFFALPPDSIRFYSSIEGPGAPFPIEAGYIMWPLEVRGDWMRVRAVAPSDYCFDPPSPRQDTLWIRFRAQNGRPRVWFYTVGC
jgi:hypothetical protein